MATADRFLGTLQLFTAERPDWSVEEAAEHLQVSVSTIYRYFNIMCDAGFLDSMTRGRYVLGPAFIAFDRQIRLMDPMLQTAIPVMKRLVAHAGGKGVALLCRRFRDRIMCVHQENASVLDVDISFERGRPLGMVRGAASKAILAHLPIRLLRSIYNDHAASIAEVGLGRSWEEFRLTLKGIRAAGFSVTRAELDADRVGIATPIFVEGNVVGSVSMVLHAIDATNPFVANVSTLVQAAGREIDATILELSQETLRKTGSSSEGNSVPIVATSG